MIQSKDAPGAQPAESPLVAELRATIEELRQAVQARDEFLIAAAHELRNPMTPILVGLDAVLSAAQSGAPASAIAPALENLKDNVARYVKRAGSLLDVSRLTTGRFRPELSEVDLSELTREVVQAAAPVARYSGSQLNLAIQDGVVGLWDRLALEQIVENLLSNAIKYGAGNPVEVALSADRSEARLAVSDQGIGISAEDQARIFDRFERAVTRSQHGGFGVGLWTVGRLTAALNGEITVASAPGRGSTFTVRLPLRSAAQQEGSSAS